MMTRDHAADLDAADPLARWRDEFVFADPDLVYLDGNSLGMPPKRAFEMIDRVLHTEWSGGLIRSWTGTDRGAWVDRPRAVGDLLAPLIGALPGEVVVHDTTTMNIYQLVHGALAMRPDRTIIAVDADEFPTDRYVADGIAAATGRSVRLGFERLDDVAVMLRSVVDYRTAEVVDVAAETARARSAGAVVIWDLSHAAGVLAIDLHAAGAQLAVGCSYKFLNGGPGAPAWTYVASELQPSFTQPIWGWFSQHDQFAMGPTYNPRTDIMRMVVGTPNPVALAGAEAGFSVTADAGIDAIQTKARLLTGFGIDLCDQFGLHTRTPRDPLRRGGHVAVVHPEARRLNTQLADRGVLGDFREPDVVRLGMSPLTTRFVDVFDGVALIAELAAG